MLRKNLNVLDENAVLTPNTSALFPTNEELTARKNSADSWGNYKFAFSHSESSMRIDKGKRSDGTIGQLGEILDIDISIYETIEEAKDKMPLQMKGDRIADISTAGNERLTALYEVRGFANIWFKTFVFRRNNIIVEIEYQSALGIPSNSEKILNTEEMAYYADLIDKKIIERG